MASISTLAAIFREGNHGFRRKEVVQYCVVQRVKDDPLRCLHLYRELHGPTGTGRYAAECFLMMLETARTRSPVVVWLWSVVETRPAPRPLPG